MKSSKLFSMAVLATAVAAVTGLTACSSSPSIEAVVVPPASESALTISLKPVDTRAATDITEKENTVNRVAVGIFDSDGNVKMVKTFESGDITSGTVTLTTTTALATTDHVLVACNAPANTFKDAIPTESDFRAKTITIDEALYGAGSSTTTDAVDFTNLPMFGHNTEELKQEGTNFTASVDVYHLVAKVTLESFELVNQGAMTNASFEPEDIFLAHVPDQLDFQNVTATSTSAAYFTDPALPYSNYYHGCLTNKPTGDNAAFLGRAYLGMKATTSTVDSKTVNTVNGLVAYTMPNSQTDDNHATFLVVKGKFHYKSGDAGTEVLYPLYINYSTATDGTTNDQHVGDPKKVYPNFNYKMKVKVMGFGEKPAYDDNGNPKITPLVPRTVSVTVTPQSFVDATSEVTLN